MAKLAVASYLTGGPDQSLLALFSGQTRGILDRSAMISYMASAAPRAGSGSLSI